METVEQIPSDPSQSAPRSSPEGQESGPKSQEGPQNRPTDLRRSRAPCLGARPVPHPGAWEPDRPSSRRWVGAGRVRIGYRTRGPRRHLRWPARGRFQRPLWAFWIRSSKSPLERVTDSLSMASHPSLPRSACDPRVAWRHLQTPARPFSLPEAHWRERLTPCAPWPHCLAPSW